jgi:hypothetical protein
LLFRLGEERYRKNKQPIEAAPTHPQPRKPTWRFGDYEKPPWHIAMPAEDLSTAALADIGGFRLD